MYLKRSWPTQSAKINAITRISPFHKYFITDLLLIFLFAGCNQTSTTALPTLSQEQRTPIKISTPITTRTSTRLPEPTFSPTQPMQSTLAMPVPETRVLATQADNILHSQCLNIFDDLSTHSDLPSSKLILVGSSSISFDLSTGKITDFPTGAENFLVSKDGKWLAYRVYSSDSAQERLVIDSLNNEHQIQLPWKKEWISIKEWTLNNRLLINLHRKPLASILLLDPFHNQWEEVAPVFPDIYQITTAMPFQFRASNFEPNSTLHRIIYPLMIDGHYYVGLWDKKTNQVLAKIEDLYPFDHDPIWKVDGQSFLIPVVTQWNDQPLRNQIIYEWFEVDQEGKIQQLTHLGDSFTQSIIDSASLSPDGHLLAFGLSVQPNPYKRQQLAVLNLETQTVTSYCIPDSMSRGVPPVWSPNNRFIAVQDNYAKNAWRTILVDTKNNWAAQMPDNLDQFSPAAWLP